MPGILFDLDGVFYVGDAPVPGAAEALHWVRREAIPHLFLTNTTSRPRSALVDKLAGMGIRVEAGEILTPPVAAGRWLREHGADDAALFVPEATRAEFADLGVTAGAPAGPVSAVVVGDLGEGWDFATYNAAFRALMTEPRPPLLALGATRYWKAPDGLRLDVGAFVAGLEYATGTEAVVLGKPAAAFFETALELLGCRPEETVMVGDDIRGDIGGAQEAGIAGVLVRTGKFRPEDLEGDIRPDDVLDSISSLPDAWGGYWSSESPG